ncbi:MAG: carboxypeptidase regulatory-like domain-containing protein, partial [Calditrichaeota bacterium]|nr:carboxypeptidase regulatory-like domain-containing protein [Calditrichota bacterium]
MLLRPALIALLAVCTGLQALPSILVDPDQFAFEMPHGTVENSVLNIANDGDEPLEVVVSLGVPRRDVTVNVVLWTRFATDQWRLGNLITGLSTIEADLRRIDFNDYTPDALEEVLSNAHVLVLPEQPGASQGFLFDLGRTWTDVLRDFLDRGGYIVGAESAGGIARLLEGAGLMSIRIASLAQQLNCTSNDHPITAGIPNFVALRTCNVHRAIGFESQQLTRIEGWGEEFTNISARRHGRGGIAYLGMNWWQYNDDMNFLLGNAVLWFQGGASWLLLERFAGTIRPDDSRDVFFTIDSRLTSEPGEYRRDILITSNDPANPRVTVPVDLTVTSWLPSELALTPEAFFVISRRDSAAVLIANNLGEGMLRAEVFLDDPNQQWLTINRNELVIPGGFEDRVLLRFSAANARTGFNANRLVIRYANPDTIETLVPITYYTGSTFGALEGRVTEALSGDPVTGVFISLDGLEAETDQNGDYRFPTVPVSNYQISLDARDYLPYRSGWLTIRENETASNDIALRWCSLEMTFDPDLQIASPGGHLTRIDGQFSNPGDGELRFNTEFREPAVPRNLNPWQTRLVLAPGSAVAATELYGVAFARERIYLSGLGPDQEPWLWRLDRNGALLDSIRQPGDHPRGMSDLAWDGELVWGADD